MKIICIGRNYADHAKEMKAALPTEPLYFLKPDTALLREGDFYYPKFTSDLHFECELVVRIEKVGKHIAQEFAHKYYTHFTLGIDFTARDLQQHCKENGLPWERAKGFEDYKKSLLGLSWKHNYNSNIKHYTSIFSAYFDGDEARPFSILKDFSTSSRSELNILRQIWAAGSFTPKDSTTIQPW